MNPVLIEVLRGGTVESRHAGALAIVDATGHVHTALGDIDRPVFPRSAVKLLQALPLVASGAADSFGLTDEELAVACASHSGEPEHVATAAGMLAKLGLDAGALECGTQWPSREPVLRAMATRGEAATPLHNNCSGKHGGFVCVACLMARNAGAEPAEFARGYVAAGHPVMREVAAALSAATGVDVEQAPRGIDGCSIPTHALPPWRWPSHARARARGWRRAMRAPRAGCAKPSPRRPSWSAAPTASTRASCRPMASACSARSAPRACTARPCPSWAWAWR
jgi:L-asparaginase II